MSVQGSSKTAREYVDRLRAWLEAHPDTPFFAFLHVFDPHDPYEPYRPYDAMWADPAHKNEHQRQLQEVRKVIQAPLLRLFGMPSRDDLKKAGLDPQAFVRHDKDWYDGSIRGMDVEIGRVLQTLRRLGLDESTLLVFLSDHGEEFHDHGRMFHGQTVYGELYDFAKDPLNLTDVAAAHPDVVARLTKALDGWKQMAQAARLKPDAESAKTLSPEQLQRLRSLGYVR